MSTPLRALPTPPIGYLARDLVPPAELARQVVAAALTLPNVRELERWIVAELVRVVHYERAVFVEGRDANAAPKGPGADRERRLVGRLVARGVELASIHMFRSAGAHPFDEGDRRALSEVLPTLTIAYAAQQRWEAHAPCAAPHLATSRPLRPRVRETLRCLLAGMSEKEVAHSMSLSPHTVHQYVKLLYRAYGVRSRSELLARLLAK